MVIHVIVIVLGVSSILGMFKKASCLVNVIKDEKHVKQKALREETLVSSLTIGPV